MNVKIAFWDSSALVPLCAPWQGDDSRLWGLLVEFPAIVWWASPVEVRSAIARQLRLGEIAAAQEQAALRRLTLLRQDWTEILPNPGLRELAEDRLSRHELRAAAALQLAAALTWCRERPAGRPFLCRDRRLIAAARAEGFLVLEPSQPKVIKVG